MAKIRSTRASDVAKTIAMIRDTARQRQRAQVLTQDHPQYQCNVHPEKLDEAQWLCVWRLLGSNTNTKSGFVDGYQIRSLEELKHRIVLDRTRAHLQLGDPVQGARELWRRVLYLSSALHHKTGIAMSSEEQTTIMGFKDLISYMASSLVNNAALTSSLPDGKGHYIKHIEQQCLAQQYESNKTAFNIPFPYRQWEGTDLYCLAQHHPETIISRLESCVLMPGIGWFTVLEVEHSGAVLCPLRVANCGLHKLAEFSNPWNPHYHGYKYGNRDWVIRNDRTGQTCFLSSLSWHLFGEHNWWVNVPQYRPNMFVLSEILELSKPINDAEPIPNPIPISKTSSSSSSSFCSVCAIVSGKLFRCTGCHNILYCSRQCQKNHWSNGHKKLCRLWKGKEMIIS